MQRTHFIGSKPWLTRKDFDFEASFYGKIKREPWSNALICVAPFSFSKNAIATKLKEEKTYTIEDFEEIYDRVESLIDYFMSDRLIRDDMVQICCEKLYRYLLKHGTIPQNLNWFKKVIKNTVIDVALAEDRRSVTFMEESSLIYCADISGWGMLGKDGGVSDAAMRSTDFGISHKEYAIEIIQKARLTQEELRIIYLRYWKEMKFKEIGEILGYKEGSCRVKHSRIIQKLAKALDDNSYDY